MSLILFFAFLWALLSVFYFLPFGFETLCAQAMWYNCLATTMHPKVFCTTFLTDRFLRFVVFSLLLYSLSCIYLTTGPNRFESAAWMTTRTPDTILIFEVPGAIFTSHFISCVVYHYSSTECSWDWYLIAYTFAWHLWYSFPCVYASDSPSDWSDSTFLVAALTAFITTIIQKESLTFSTPFPSSIIINRTIRFFSRRYGIAYSSASD